MKTLFTFYLLLGWLHPLMAQSTDSIKYANGFLYYHTYGKGQPVLWLSGGPGNYCLDYIDPTVKFLSDRYRLILLEQRGTGLSIPKPFDSTTVNLRTATADINLLLDHLGIKKIVIAGHSWGAMLAMKYATEHPERIKALVHICPGPYKDTQSIRNTEADSWRFRRGLAERELYDNLQTIIGQGKGTREDSLSFRRIRRLATVADKALVDTVAKYFHADKFSSKTKELLDRDLLSRKFDLTRSLAAYPGPIYVIAGRQDVLAMHAYELKILRPSVELYWIEKSGHFPMIENPEAFYRALTVVMNDIN